MNYTYGILGEKSTYSALSLIYSILDKNDYTTVRVNEQDMRSLLVNGIVCGIYVQAPFKNAVETYCSVLSETASRTGSVDVLTLDAKKQVIGHNTEYAGFRYLAEVNGIKISGKKVVILGNGGTAATIALFMKDSQARTVEIRDVQRENPIYVQEEAQIIVNASGIGGYPYNGESPIHCDNLRKCEWIIDLVSNPLRTQLQLEAQKMGIRVVNGLAMELAQVRRILKILTGTEVSDEVMLRAAIEARRDSSNINLIGMPGSGKTTIGKMLAEKLGRRFIDTDIEFLRVTGLEPSEVILKQGEKAFREIETGILKEVSKEKGVVIATGGGIVTQEANRFLLDQNGNTIFILRDLNKLAVDGRPISKAVPVQELYAKRSPLYTSWSHMKVVNENVEDAIKEVHQFYLEKMGVEK